MENGATLYFSEDHKAAVRDGGKRFEVDHTVETVEPSNKMQIISIKLIPEFRSTQMSMLPISGFPRTFHGKFRLPSLAFGQIPR
jgi:hypothetical protein